MCRDGVEAFVPVVAGVCFQRRGVACNTVGLEPGDGVKVCGEVSGVAKEGGLERRWGARRRRVEPWSAGGLTVCLAHGAAGWHALGGRHAYIVCVSNGKYLV